jgi:hypothetical protein
LALLAKPLINRSTTDANCPTVPPVLPHLTGHPPGRLGLEWQRTCASPASDVAVAGWATAGPVLMGTRTLNDVLARDAPAAGLLEFAHEPAPGRATSSDPRSPTFGDRAGRAAAGSVTERHILLRDDWALISGVSRTVGTRLQARRHPRRDERGTAQFEPVVGCGGTLAG